MLRAEEQVVLLYLEAAEACSEFSQPWWGLPLRLVPNRPAKRFQLPTELVCGEFEGQQIKQGQTLHMLVHSSARDPEICDDPNFDITARRKIHFGFGGGAHHCLGHLVARNDMASALSALAKNILSFEVLDAEWLPAGQ